MALIDVLGAFGWDIDDRQLNRADTALGGILEKAKALVPLAVAGTVGVGLVRMTNEFVDFADEIENTAIKLRFGQAALQEWRYAAGILGVDAGKLNEILRHVSASIAQTATDAKKAALFEKELGVALTDASGAARTQEEIFQDVIYSLAEMEAGAKRDNAAMQIFGESFSELNDLFDKGADGIEHLRQELRDAGGVINDELIKASGDLNDKTDRLKATFLGLRVALVSLVIPALTWLVDKGTPVVQWLAQTLQQTNLLKAGFVVFGAVTAKAFFGVAVAARGLLAALLPYAIPVAIIAGLVILLDDLITLFTGGQSEVGAFLDGLLGAGAADRFVAWCKEAAEDLEALIDLFVGSDWSQIFADGLNEMSDSVETFLGWLDAASPALAGLAAMITTVWLQANGVFLSGMARAGLATSGFALKSIPQVIAALAKQGAALLVTAVQGAGSYVAGFASMIASQLLFLATNPFTYIVIGIGLAVAAIVWLVKNWDTAWSAIKDAFASAWDWISEKFSSGFNWLIEKFNKLRGLISNLPGLGFLAPSEGGSGGGSEGDRRGPGGGGELGPPRLPPPAGGGRGDTTNVTSEVKAPVTINNYGVSDPREAGNVAARQAGRGVEQGARRATLNALKPVKR